MNGVVHLGFGDRFAEEIAGVDVGVNVVAQEDTIFGESYADIVLGFFVLLDFEAGLGRGDSPALICTE